MKSSCWIGCIFFLYYPNFHFNRYRRKRPKVDVSIFDSVLSHTRRSDASGKKRWKYSRPLLDKLACGQVSRPRLYRLTSFFEILIFLKVFPRNISDYKISVKKTLDKLSFLDRCLKISEIKMFFNLTLSLEDFFVFCPFLKYKKCFWW